MTGSSTSQAFNTAVKPQKRKRQSPFPIRFSEEERAFLESKAGNKPLGTYIREKLLGDAQAIRKHKPRKQRVDYELLGQILGVLGESELAKNLCVLAMAAEMGSLALDVESTGKLNAACDDVREIRLMLVTALGLKPGRTQ